jgi:hypothetical protein
MIESDIKAYYENEKNSKLKIITVLNLIIIFVTLVFVIALHLILRKIFNEKVNILKSLTVIEDEEISRMHANLLGHK